MSGKDLLEELLNADDSVDTTEDTEGENEILAPLLDEINLIDDTTIRVFVRSILSRAKNFWSIPSSFSGKYHPPDEHGKGGNVLHTKRVVRIVNIMCEAQERMPFEKDMMIAAALLHDLLKGGEYGEGRYDPLHPYTVDRFVNQARVEDEAKIETGLYNNSAILEEEYVQQILRLVRCHLGKWSPIPETTPVVMFEWVLHLADKLAADLHIVIDGNNVIPERWQY